MIHEIHPHHFSNNYQSNPEPSEEDFILIYKDNTLLLKPVGDGFEIPRRKNFQELYTSSGFLCTLNNTSCYLIDDTPKSIPASCSYTELNFFRSTAQKELAWIAMLGYHLHLWYRQNRYCGQCGSLTQHKKDERALECPICEHVVYPKISPAIIVAITCNDKILLIRGKSFTGTWHSLVAGYTDIGESLEETVIREVKEEVGIDVHNIRYYKSQPWPLSGSMMIGFVAEADDRQAIKIDPNEIGEAAWFTRGKLPEYPLKISIAGEMIERFEEGIL